MNRFFCCTLAVPGLLALTAATPAPTGARRVPASSVTSAAPSLSPQATRASASYSLAEETTDLGGGTVGGSAAYTVSGTALGQPVAAAVGTSSAYTDKPGFVGQLYDVRGLAVSGVGGNLVNERGTLQLGAAPLLDDATLLAALDPGTVAWTVAGGPVASVSSAGVATAGTVYANTPATVRAASAALGLSGLGALTVVNVNNDDDGTYANDGIDDAWQVRYFGPPPNAQAGPLVDADGTGQSNFFKYVANLNPLDVNARFALVVSPVAGQPNQRTLTFSPVYSGRTYTVQYTASLTQPNWATLTNATANVNGTTETVVDLAAATAPRFYRVLVSLP